MSRAVLLGLVLLCCCGGPSERPSEADEASVVPERIGLALQAMGHLPFGSRDFPFVVDRKWDGKDGAGGLQKANFTIQFYQVRGLTPEYTWMCPIEVQMPVHSSVMGFISPSRASMMTAEVVNEAAPAQQDSRDDWRGLGTLFCNELRRRMETLFRAEYAGCGARVVPWLQ